MDNPLLLVLVEKAAVARDRGMKNPNEGATACDMLSLRSFLSLSISVIQETFASKLGKVILTRVPLVSLGSSNSTFALCEFAIS